MNKKIPPQKQNPAKESAQKGSKAPAKESAQKGSKAPAILDMRDVSYGYRRAGDIIPVLHDIHLTLNGGTMAALLGPSGAGKSTLLHIVGLLEKPDSGTIQLLGQECTTCHDRKRTALRAHAIGFVYQFHHLLQGFNAAENIAIACKISGKSHADSMERAHQLLDKMKLAHRAHHYPQELSGGEQQRVAIARALANHPRILLADEPTGNLDPKTAHHVLETLCERAQEEKSAVIFATHNMQLAGKMDKMISLQDGTLHKRTQP